MLAGDPRCSAVLPLAAHRVFCAVGPDLLAVGTCGIGGTAEWRSRLILPRLCAPLPQSVSRGTVFGKPPFSDGAASNYSLVSTCADHHGVDFGTTLHHDEVSDHRRPAVGEVDGEGARAIRIHRVSTSGRSVGEIGNDLATHRDRIDLGEPAPAIELSHRHAHLWARGSLASQFVALDGESVVASDEFVRRGKCRAVPWR